MPRSVDVGDVINNTYGVYKVLKYVGNEQIKESNGRGSKINRTLHWYECECIRCGSKTRIHRRDLKTKIKHLHCAHCNNEHITAEHMIAMRNKIKKRPMEDEITLQEIREASRESDKPYITNISTGIKRYFIMKVQLKDVCTYQHVIRCTVDGKRYYLFNRRIDSCQPIDKCICMANELNEAMSHGKEYFYWWYKNIYKKNSK